ncbi:hypothetical protein Gorai_021554, partial [Gossypium raimondii]|nr:hypothetical protein [Gossypium raimondii]
YAFGIKSCFHADFTLAIIKVSLGVGVLCLCSYITLPLYALVTQLMLALDVSSLMSKHPRPPLRSDAYNAGYLQMGSRMKRSIFDEQTSKALKKWHMAAKKRGNARKSPTRALGGSTSPSSTLHSTGHSLHRYKTTGHSTRSSYNYEDRDMSDLEAEPLTPTSTNLIIRVDHDEHATEITETYHTEARNEDDFSFAKPAPAKEP